MRTLLKVILVLIIIVTPIAIWEYYNNVVIPWTTMPKTDAALLEEQYKKYEKEVLEAGDHPPADRINFNNFMSDLINYDKHDCCRWIESEKDIPDLLQDYSDRRASIAKLINTYRPLFNDKIRFYYSFTFDDLLLPDDHFDYNSAFIISLASCMCLEFITLVNEKETEKALEIFHFLLMIVDGYYHAPTFSGLILTASSEYVYTIALLYVLHELPNQTLVEISEQIKKLPDPKRQYLNKIMGEMVTTETVLENMFSLWTLKEFLLGLLESSDYVVTPVWYGPKYLEREKAWNRLYYLQTAKKIAERYKIPMSVDIVQERFSAYTIYSGFLLHHINFDKFAYRFTNAAANRSGLLRTIREEQRRRKGGSFSSIVPITQKHNFRWEDGRWHFTK